MNEENDNRIKWLHVRLKLTEYNKLHKNFGKTTCRKLSEYVRKIILNKPVTTTYRNRSLDDFMAEMIELRKELNAIGNNFNQVVKKLHSIQKIEAIKSLLITYEREEKILLVSIDEIKNRINQIDDKWLQ